MHSVGVTILQTASLTEKPIINMIGVIAVVIAFDGLITSLNQHRHLGNLNNLEAAFHWAEVNSPSAFSSRAHLTPSVASPGCRTSPECQVFQH